jgi:DNA damage-inducible protein 1
MLKAHQACIDLKKNVLRIQDREVRFLPEHELPDNARISEAGLEVVGPSTHSSAAGPSSSAPPSSHGGQPSFPGAGHTLGTPVAGHPAPTQGTPSRYAEKDIGVLMDLGASREMAISSLDAAGGNVDVAASLLF